MGRADIKIIDIREHCGARNKILSFEEQEIIFTKEIERNGKYYFSINSYELSTGVVEEIYTYEISEAEFYSQHTYIIENDILIIKPCFKNLNSIEVDALDRNSKKIKSKHIFEVKEEVTSIPIVINSRYFLFYADIDEMDEDKYGFYKEAGYSHFIYLCDLLEDQIYLVNDLRLINGLTVVHGLLDCLPTFTHNDEEYLLFNETYMEDYEYEEYIYNAINDGRLDKNLVKEIEGLYYIPVNDFVQSIKRGQKNIQFKEIKKRYLDGWVRYLGMDERNIYFREKDFKTGIEKVHALDKEKFVPTVVKEIHHKNIKGRLIYGDTIYEEVELDHSIEIRGIYNFDDTFSFKKGKNLYFKEMINHRYLICWQWVEDEEENYFEFVHIMDLQSKGHIKYEGACSIYNNDIVLYR